MAAPTKAEQVAESLARTNAGVSPADNAAALDVVDDGARGDPGAPPAPRQAAEPEPQRQAPPVKSVFDDRRNAIVARFRTDRAQDADEQRDDISDFARSGMPPEFTQTPAIEPGPELEPEPIAAQESEEQPEPQPAVASPKTVKLKVRGQEIEVPLEEALGKAQIAYAADNYLDEAKGKLGEVDALLRRTRDNAPRAGQDGTHPADPNRAQPVEPDAQPSVDPQHPEDPIAKLIDTLQFGDPADARTLLENTIRRGASEAVVAELQGVRLRDEGARTAKVLKDFEDKHPDIAKDKRARAAIESDVFDQQIEDIKALGVDPAKIRPDGASPTPGDIANAHRWYRAQGFAVKTPSDMLETATKNFLDWKGIKTTEPTAEAAPRAQPRVDVSVERSARRQTIPQQPSRTVAPRQDAPRQQQPAQPRDRSAIVQDMMRGRAAPRGKVAVV